MTAVNIPANKLYWTLKKDIKKNNNLASFCPKGILGLEKYCWLDDKEWKAGIAWFDILVTDRHYRSISRIHLSIYSTLFGDCFNKSLKGIIGT